MDKKESIITNDREALKSIERKLGLVQRDLERAKNRMSRRHLRESINDLKIELGWSFLDRGEYEEGLVLYHTIPWTTHGEANCNGIARALTEMGYYDEARRLLEVGLRKLPKSYALWVAMGACPTSGSGGQFFNCYIFQEANPEHFDHRSANPSISFPTGSPICHPLGKALLSPAS